MSISFQYVGPDHLDTLCQLSRDTFSAAFAAHNDPTYFQQYLDQAFSRSQLSKEMQDSDSSFMFACWKGSPVGYLKLVFNKLPKGQEGGSGTELQRIYVLPGFQGKKLGKGLMEQALEQAQGVQSNFIWLGVWEHNPQAIAFYRLWGFTPFGEHTFYMGPEAQRDILMGKALF